jgi:hypothetical protein
MTAPGGPPSARARRAAVALLPALLVATAACTPADDDAAPGPSTAAPTPTDAVPPAEDVALPDGPAGEAAGWLLDRLGDPVGTALESPEDRFAAAFLAEVPAAELEALLDQLRAQGPWTPTAASGDAAGVVVTVEGGGTSLDMQVAVDAAGLVQGLFFAPTPPPREPAASWEELGDEVEGWDLRSGLLVARVDADGTCTPVGGTPVGTAPGEPLPMGSVAKLYVLGAVVDAVAAGALAWEDALTVTDDARSLPSGRLQDVPDGTTVTVLDAARDMIAISDNTATDLLVAAVGRDRVEAAVADMGHADPGSLAPFPTTRDLFRLGWGGGPELRAAWRDGDEAQRRALIEGLPPGPLRIDVAEVASTVVWPEGVDWFGTPLDLCAAHVALAERGATPAGEPVREILAANPGAGRTAGEAGAVPAGTWPYLAFKGGSAPGTMAGAWYAEGPDDDGAPERVVVVLQTAAPTAQGALPAATMVGVAADALRLAADEG